MDVHKRLTGKRAVDNKGLFDSRLRADEPAGVSRGTGSIKMSSKDKKRVGYS